MSRARPPARRWPAARGGARDPCASSTWRPRSRRSPRPAGWPTWRGRCRGARRARPRRARADAARTGASSAVAGPLRVVVPRMPVPLGDREVEGALLEGRPRPACPSTSSPRTHYYDRASALRHRDGDYWDNCERFVFFCRGARAAAARGSVGLAARRSSTPTTGRPGCSPSTSRRSTATRRRTRTWRRVFTIHNLAYQGVFWHYDMPMTGLGLGPLHAGRDRVLRATVNLLKGGLSSPTS